MKTFRQIAAVTVMNLRSLPQRAATSLVIVIGIAGVVAVMISVLAMSTGMIKTMSSSGRDDRAVVLRNGSTTETSSAITRDSLRVLMDMPGVQRDAEGKPILSADALRFVTLHKKEDDTPVNVVFRGIDKQSTKLRPELRITAGRMFNPAVNEVIVGKNAAAQYKGAQLGGQVKSRTSTWQVVGIFESNGDSHESEVLGDTDTLISSDGRRSYSSINVLLESPAAFDKFKDAVSSNPALAMDVLREREYYKQASQGISRVISFLAYVVGGIMAVGAVFGALNTMYSAVSERLREIATLRALGFGATAMVVSVLVEALLLAAIGGVIGAILAWVFFNGNTVSTGGTAQGQLIFDLSVSPQLVALGIIWAAVIGLIGGLFPAIRAARLPVAAALRAI